MRGRCCGRSECLSVSRKPIKFFLSAAATLAGRRLQVKHENAAPSGSLRVREIKGNDGQNIQHRKGQQEAQVLFASAQPLQTVRTSARVPPQVRPVQAVLPRFGTARRDSWGHEVVLVDEIRLCDWYGQKMPFRSLTPGLTCGGDPRNGWHVVRNEDRPAKSRNRTSPQVLSTVALRN